MSGKVAFSKDMEAYFNDLNLKKDECYVIAENARSKGKDPELRVEIPQAEDLASRVEKLLAEWKVDGIADVIRKLTDEYGNREVVSLMVAKHVASARTGSREEIIDRAVRVGLAVLTEGILVAPLEGIAETKIRENADGSEYIDLVFAGPIRAAGGTGQAMSVLIADMVRREMGIGKYIPTDQEIRRFHEEIPLYKQCQHLQYMPSPKEITLIVSNCPVCIDGEGTEKEEISGFRDLPRIPTNKVRGGACLVIAEGLCQKAAKIKKHVDKLKIDGWDFVGELITSKGGDEKKDECVKVVKPQDKYLKDIIAGRPIFGHPSRPGGFRLRYGRGRTCGLAAIALSPASMYALDEFTALGTQIKIERPGKAGAVTPCDSIEGPILLLNNGDLVYCATKEEVIGIRKEVSEIVDNGEILIPFGEFSENNHMLVPCGYAPEWHKQELLATGKIPDDWADPSYERAMEISVSLKVPLHPKFNLFWYDVSMDDLTYLRQFIISNGRFDKNLIIKTDARSKRTLEDLGAIHRMNDGEAVIDGRYGNVILDCLALSPGTAITSKGEFAGTTSLEAVSSALGVEVRARARTRIGARMARPEKADDRRNPEVHALFPIGKEAGNKKELFAAIAAVKENQSMSKKKTTSVPMEVGTRMCPSCGAQTWAVWCRDCGVHTNFVKAEKVYGDSSRMTMFIDLEGEMAEAMSATGITKLSEVKCLETLPSKIKAPETLEKGVLRSVNNVSVFKDGTIRFDMTDVPITHFRPREIEMTVEKAIELGYTKDMFGNPLTSDEQLCELKVQDFIPADSCGEHLVRVAKFIDDMLEKLYGMERFYNVTNRDELIGHLGIGLAPHTSGGILCRIIGYTKACGGYAHPFFHAAKRRNCDGDEDSIILLLDGLINFSRGYLPDRRGGLMDAPLVLTTRLDPNEIDKEAHNVDCLLEYPRDFYYAAMDMKDPKEIEKIMDLIGGRIGTEKQYEGLGFTHDTKDISEGPKHSAYTTLESMMDKMEAQLYLGKKIRAVDERDVIAGVIDKHFLPDMAGNLRSFSAQSVRCTKCNEKYRRIPLSGLCKCGNTLILTVHEGSVKKYLEVSKEMGEKYGLSEYTRQRIAIMEMSMTSLFDNDKVKKCKLSDFF